MTIFLFSITYKHYGKKIMELSVAFSLYERVVLGFRNLMKWPVLENETKDNNGEANINLFFRQI